MSDTREVISAFLDDEPFEPASLGEALADPAGRAMLIDLVALRHLVREIPVMAAPSKGRRSRGLALLVAAVILLALIGGYRLGERRGIAAADDPPAPMRVVPATGQWQ